MNCNLVKKAKQRRKQKKNVTFRPVQINQMDFRRVRYSNYYLTTYFILYSLFYCCCNLLVLCTVFY